MFYFTHVILTYYCNSIPAYYEPKKTWQSAPAPSPQQPCTPSQACRWQCCHMGEGVRCSSVVRAFAHGAMGRRIFGSILHGVDPLSYFSFQPVLHDWCFKGRGMCYPVYGIVYIKDPFLPPFLHLARCTPPS